MGEEKYSNFDSPSTDKASILPDIKFGRNLDIKLRELALGACLFAAVVALIVLAALLGGKNDTPKSSPSIYESICVSGPCLKSASYVTQNMNKTADPCTDFFQYACGGYPTQFPLNPTMSSRTMFSNLYFENEEKIENLLNAPLLRTEEWSSERKIKHLFESCTDTYAKDTAKGAPVLTKILPEIGGWYVTGTLDTATWNFQEALKKTMIDFWTHAFFTAYVANDWNDDNRRVVELHLSGTSMYWYYFVSEDTIKYRSDLRKLMMTLATYMLRDSNVTLDEATKTERLNTFVSDAYYVESMLANITQNSSPVWDPHAEEERETMQDFDAMTGNTIDFSSIVTSMFAEAELRATDKIVLFEKDYLIQMSNLVGSLGPNSTRILSNYLVWRIIHKYRQELSWDYIHANRDFYVDLYGTPNFLGTTKYCFNTMEMYLGDALSALFVRDHFSDKNKAKVVEIVKFVKEALASTTVDHIFDKETRKLAKEKLDAAMYKLGYPDFLTNDSEMDSMYSPLKVDKDDYFSNVLSMNQFIRLQWNRRLSSGQDKSEWYYRVYDTLISFYNGWNELIIPAGLLQFPFYDHTLPHFMNFGTMGSIVGHYLVHSIDEWGAYYQKDGKYENWWSNYTKTRWEETKQCVGDYYSTKTMGPFTVPGDPKPVTVPVNGKYYGYEGIAEASGVKVAYKAYLNWIKNNVEEKKAPGLDLSNEQMFFVAFAQTMCYTRNDNTAYNYAIRGIISEQVRTNSILSQLPEFVEAFKCPVKSPMNAEEKCSYF
ncbi:endothelin-converting enzyme 1-like [Ylistrum balloti]|uniref:endothelin-converting enzyme 1-like n=1 Tax=Ylistrum balloti TaxID=509963 RepID=UPI002905A5B7|nr:endothelin-converting enzyme 1-like [Ylistrum balloti]